MLEYWNPRCQPPWEAHELEKKVKNAYTHNRDIIGKFSPKLDFEKVAVDPVDLDWQLLSNGTYQKTPHNVCLFLMEPDTPIHNMVAYNLFSKCIEFIKKAPWHWEGEPIGKWTDNDTTHLRLYLNKHKKFLISKENLTDGVLEAAKKLSYHPIKQYLEAIKWDGIKRLDEWAIKYLGCEDTQLTRTISRKFMIAAIARMYTGYQI